MRVIVENKMALHYVLYSTAYLNSCSCYGMRSVTS